MENTRVGPFLIIKKLGSHRRHNVYHARQVEQDRDVAIKFIKLPPHVDRDKALAKINHEVHLLRRLEHKNLVQIYGAGVEQEKVFFAHELIEGETLATFLARRGRLAPDLAIDYGRQIAGLLEYLHDNEIIHSKLTTDKIIIEPSGNIKVADLRLNRSRKRRWDAARRAQLEVAAYLAPEQLLENGTCTKSDLYSLGVILYEMLTGHLPYEPETMKQLIRAKQNDRAPSVTSNVMNCPGWLDRLTASLLEPDMRARPHTARAVVLALDEIKKIDQSKKTAVEKMTGGFSALTAGSDKSEARRLLGIKKEKKPRGPILQSIPFLLAGLFAIGLLVGIISLWPTNRTSIMERAAVLMQSENPRDWQSARTIYRRIMKSSDRELAAEAEKMYFESRRLSLLNRAKVGLVGLETQNVRKFCLAYYKEEEGLLDEAITRFKQLVDTVASDGDQQHVYAESKKRYDRLLLAKHQARDERENLVALLDEADALVKQDESPKAIQIYRQIVNQFSENGFLTSHVAKAKAQLELLGESIAEQAPADRNDKDANETIDDKNSDDDRSGTPPDSK